MASAVDAPMLHLAQIFATLAAKAKLASDALGRLNSGGVGDAVEEIVIALKPLQASFGSLRAVADAFGGLRATLVPASAAMGGLLQSLGNLTTVKQFMAGLADIRQGLITGLSVPVTLAASGASKALAATGGFARYLGREFSAAGADIKTRFVSSFPKFATALAGAGKSVGLFATAALPVIGAMAKLGGAVGALALVAGAKTLAVGGMVAGGAVKGAVAVGGAVGGAAKGVLDGTLGAIAGVAGAFTGIIGIASKFVEALNPAIMEQLNLAFSDLFAVVGRLFVPVMAAVIPIVRTFADAMVPVVQGLMPVFGILAEALMNLAGPIIGIFSGVLLTLTPIFEQFAKGLSEIAATIGNSLGPIIDAILPVLMVLLQLFIDLLPAVNDVLQAFALIFTSGLQLAIPYLVWALQGLAEAIVYVVSWFGKTMKEGAVIMSDFAKTLMPEGGPTKTLKVPEITPDASRGAASKGAQFMGFAELGKGLMAASFGSGANTPEMKTAENTGKIAAGIDRLVAGQNPPPAGGLPINQPGAGKR